RAGEQLTQTRFDGQSFLVQAGRRSHPDLLERVHVSRIGSPRRLFPLTTHPGLVGVEAAFPGAVEDAGKVLHLRWRAHQLLTRLSHDVVQLALESHEERLDTELGSTLPSRAIEIHPPDLRYGLILDRDSCAASAPTTASMS